MELKVIVYRQLLLNFTVFLFWAGSHYVIKYPDQCNLYKKAFNLRNLMVAGTAESLYLTVEIGGRESELGIVQESFETSEPFPSDTYRPTSPHLSVLPKQVQQLGTKHLKM